MHKSIKESKEIKYFAAANGYSGFRSYFSDVFNPEKFTKLYVLKGGPGTGKSTLMKGVLAYAKERKLTCDAIYCSSDPNSLDGVIISNGYKKIAVIDATAPHETDAHIPGAYDEIINLGEGWDASKLENQKEEILRLNKLKSKHYKNAYEYLFAAGVFDKLVTRVLDDAYVADDSHIINNIIKDIRVINCGRDNKLMLLSSFGKDGNKSLEVDCEEFDECISVTGIFGSQYIFIQHLQDELSRRKIPFTRIPSPFSDDISEAIIINGSEILISGKDTFDNSFDTKCFLDNNIIKEERKKLEYYVNVIDELLEFSKKEFALASQMHFALEDIYTPTMNFENNEKVKKSIISKLDDIL